MQKSVNHKPFRRCRIRVKGRESIFYIGLNTIRNTKRKRNANPVFFSIYNRYRHKSETLSLSIKQLPTRETN